MINLLILLLLIEYSYQQDDKEIISYITSKTILSSPLDEICDSSSSSSSSAFTSKLCNLVPLSFSRVNINSDINKHLSIKLYGDSKESVGMKTMLLFRSPINQIKADLYGGIDEKYIHNNTVNQYHNALLINGQFHTQYYKIMKDSNFEYNNEIPLLTLGQHITISYTIITNDVHWRRLTKYTRTDPLLGSTRFTTITFPYTTIQSTSGLTSSSSIYQAVLALDHYSSIWDQYNILSIDSNFVTFRYSLNGELTKTMNGYNGKTTIQCNTQYHHPESIDNRCIIDKIYQMSIGRKGGIQQVLSSKSATLPYRLIIDLHSSTNHLPTNLYFYMRSLPKKDQHLIFNLGRENLLFNQQHEHHMNTDTTIKTTLFSDISHNDLLHINSNFKYELNENNNDIIIGVDLLHIFPSIEFSIEKQQINLWYSIESYLNNDSHNAVAIFFSFMVLLCIIFYIYIIISTNHRHLFRSLIIYSQVVVTYYFFSFKQVFFEISILVFSFITLLITFVFTDYVFTTQFQRLLILFITILYHGICLIIVLINTPDVTLRAFSYYFHYHPSTKVINQLKGNTIKIPQTPINQSNNDIKDYFGTKTTTTTTTTTKMGGGVYIYSSSPSPLSSIKTTKNNDDYMLYQRKQQVHNEINTYFDDNDIPSLEIPIKRKEDRYRILDRKQELDNIRVKDRDFEKIKDIYLDHDNKYDQLIKIKTTTVIIRNILLVILVLSNLLLLINYSTVVKQQFLLIFVVISYILIFYIVTYLTICILLLSVKGPAQKSLSFIVFLIGEVLFLLFFLGWTTPAVFLEYYVSINTIFSYSFIVGFTMIFMGLIILISVKYVLSTLDKIIREKYT